jgi:hypothetical protein
MAERLGRPRVLHVGERVDLPGRLTNGPGELDRERQLGLALLTRSGRQERRAGPQDPREPVHPIVQTDPLRPALQRPAVIAPDRCQQILGLGALGLAAVVAFIVRQLRTAAPLFPVRVIALHNVRAIAALQLLTGIGMTGSAIYMTIELQLVHGISPAATGVRLLPMAAGLAIGGALALLGADGGRGRGRGAPGVRDLRGGDDDRGRGDAGDAAARG